MATIKKAQYGDRITSRQKKRLGRISEKNPERAKEVAERMKLRATRRKRGSDLYDSLSPKEDLPAFKARTLEEAKKAKNGKSFPDLNKDGKITKADILKGRGVIAKKGANIKKAQAGSRLKDSDYETSPFVKAQMEMKQRERGRGSKSMDSTGIYKKRAEDAGNKLLKDDIRNFGKNVKDFATKQADLKRYGRKGKPGYDEQGNRKPLSLKFKLRKGQAGLTASNKRVGPSDPNGAWTKVQEMNLPPRNVKTSVSLKKDKQLGATKMMKMGGKAKAKKKK